MRQLLLLLAFVPVFSFAVVAVADSDVKKPLDLPAGGLGDNEDDEDAPETILFYGSEFEGNAMFWCFHCFNF